MKTYIKPNLNVVELSVKESIAALTPKNDTKTFGFGSGNSQLSKLSRTLITLNVSDLNTTAS